MEFIDDVTKLETTSDKNSLQDTYSYVDVGLMVHELKEVAVNKNEVVLLRSQLISKPVRHLYRFTFDVGRMGSVEGVFIASPEEVKESLGCTAYFGEVLGKHSEVFTELKDGMFEIVLDGQVDKGAVETLEQAIGTTISGYNPLDYIDEEFDYEEDE